MTIRYATANDIDDLKQLYYDTIISINKKDYSSEQIIAWAATSERTESLLKKIAEQYFFVAENAAQQITGFGSLDKSGCLDLLYVHKDFQGQGIAKLLLDKIVITAGELNFKKIETHASITAKNFFEKNNFIVKAKQVVQLNNVPLTNYKMERIL